VVDRKDGDKIKENMALVTSRLILIPSKIISNITNKIANA
jgi:hypothetical protein